MNFRVQIEESVISTEKPVKQTCKQCDTCNNLATTVVIIVLAILLAVFVSARLITIIRPKRYGRRDQPINGKSLSVKLSIKKCSLDFLSNINIFNNTNNQMLFCCEQRTILIR